MVTYNGKALVVVAVVALIAAVAAASPFHRRRATVLVSGERVSIHRPTLLQRLHQSDATLSVDAPTARRIATIRDGLFEYPVMLVPKHDSRELMCLYNFDVGYRVLIFELDAQRVEARDAELAVMVTSTAVPVRHATSRELMLLRDTVQSMDDPSYRASSLPALDLGFLSIYASKAALADRIDETYKRAVQLERAEL